jgi:tight adherence protein C
MGALTLAFALTIFLTLALIIMLTAGRSQVMGRLMQVARVQTVPAASGVRIDAKSLISKWLAPVRKAIGLSDDSGVGKRLALAGHRQPSNVDTFYAAKVGGVLLGALIAGFLLRGSNILLWFFVLAALGFFAPDIWLERAISQRRDRIRYGLPDALDLLVICMEAGLGMDQALLRVGQELRITHPELSDEFLLINLEQRAGKPRIEAWRAMADRTQLEIVRSFLNMLIQTERFGTPLSKSLGFFADALRTKRRQQAEELAAKTTIKLVFPLALFIFPSMFIVLLGPAVISIMESFKHFGK